MNSIEEMKNELNEFFKQKKDNMRKNQPLIALDKDSVLWLITNQDGLANCSGSSSSLTFLGLKERHIILADIFERIQHSMIPKGMQKYKECFTPIPVEIAKEGPLKGKYKIRGTLLLNHAGVRGWRMAGLPGLVEGKRVDVDIFLKNGGRLGNPVEF
jgi:hypothetical protein